MEQGLKLKIDITGQRFGTVQVIEPSHRINRKTYWRCRCDCGRVYYTTKSVLERCQSCGCERVKNVRRSMEERFGGDEMIGRTFGDYTVLERRPSVNGRRRWLCRCRCGNVVEMDTTRLHREARCTCNRKKYTRRVSVSNV